MTLGIGYVVALTTASGDAGGGQQGALAIPLLGPWLALGAKQENPCDLDVTPGTDPASLAATEAQVKTCVTDALNAAARLAFIAADGAVQAIGAALLIAGTAGGRRELVRDDLRRVRVTASTQAAGHPGITLRFAM